MKLTLLLLQEHRKDITEFQFQYILQTTKLQKGLYPTHATTKIPNTTQASKFTAKMNKLLC
jgi:hypothetical protein